MKRRNFLRRAAALGVPTFLGASGLGAAPAALLRAVAAANNDDRVLVLVQLLGGNDGLHTLVPLNQYAELTQVRPNIVLPEASLIGVNDANAFHPSLQPWADLYNQDRLGIVQSVGYPNQNRSHFRSTDIWTSASAADEEITTGWLGRHFDLDHNDYPTGYPNADHPHPLAMIMGNVVTATCQGEVANYSLAVNNPANFTYVAPGGSTPVPAGHYGDELAFVRQAIAQSNEYGSIVMDADAAGNSLADYPATGLGNQLRNVARLLSGGLQTRIFVVTIGGFDTHANQTSGDNTTGVHAELLDNLSRSVGAFQDDLDQLGLADRVLGMTFSEFGRQVRSNGSNGTDHGNAAPLFLFGNCVQGGMLGTEATIDVQMDNNEGVDLQYDFRDVYGSVLTDWFGLADSTVRDLLYPEFQYLPILSGCSALPVSWLSFTASGRAEDVLLRWQTTSETNNEGFAVERGIDGRSFTSIGFVAGRGNTNGVSDYDFADRNAHQGVLYYYRLRQVDQDGASAYSVIRTARLSGSAVADWQVGPAAPNPIRPDSIIQVYAPHDAMAEYEIFNSSGRRVHSGRYSLIGGRDNRLRLGDLSGLPAGIYHWRMRSGQRHFTRKLLRR